MPQVNPEVAKPVEQADQVAAEEPPHQAAAAVTPERPRSDRPVYLTPVDTKEQPVNRGIHMYASRHEQVKDLEYIEKRNPWQIIEDALEEYVIRHYGKLHRRR